MVEEGGNSPITMKLTKTPLLPFVFAFLAPISFAAQFEDGDDFYDDLEVPELHFRVFGDLGASYENPDSLSNGGFGFGSLDFIVTGTMGEHLLFFSETLIEGAGEDSIGLDQERAWAMWSMSDEFYLKMGMDHTVVSLWNRTYHHGKWLETTISRPFLATFEDDGGALPMHYVGLETGGLWQTTGGELDWTAILSNGRGPDVDNRQRVGDSNDSKAVALSLAFTPASFDALTFGVSGHMDLIPPDLSDAARLGNISESILGLFATYECAETGAEWIGEWSTVTHDDAASGTTYDHNLAYLQVERSIENWTPYTRFDMKNMDMGDPYFSPLNQDLDRWQQTIGLRKEIADGAALKFEVGFGRGEVRGIGGVQTDDIITAALQLSWTF